MSDLVSTESRAKALQDALKKAEKSIAAVAAKGLSAERVVKIVIGAAMRNPTLLQCSPPTVVRSVIQAVELGLEPGGALNHAYLVPFWNSKVSCYECQLIVGYMGIVDLAYRSGLIDFFTAEVVYEGDEFEYELGMEPKLRHIPKDETIEDSKITHAYMVVGIKGGARIFKVLTRKQIERLRNMSQTGKDGAKYGPKGPWVEHYAEMAKKAVIRNGTKLVPKSIEVARVIAFDEAVDSEDWSGLDFTHPDALPDVEPEDAPSQIERTSGRILQAVNEL